MKKLLIAATLTLSAAIVMAQGTALLIVPHGVRLPQDSMMRVGLLASLEGWLAQSGGPDTLNTYLKRETAASTAVFMNELRSIDWYGRRDSPVVCKCYLGNVITLDSVRCLVQLNYMELRKDTPVLKACCTMLAQRGDDNKWMMSSMLEQNTVEWKTKKF